MSRRSLGRTARFLREGNEGGGGGNPAPETTPKPDLSWDDLRAQFEEQGLNPGQVRGRLDASRKWEERAKAIKPDELAALREKAARVDALEYELGSDKDKAVADAKKAAEAEVRSAYVPRLVNAEFRIAAAGRGIEADRLATILEPLDMSKFLTDDGDVDTDRVTAFIDGIAPAKGTGTPPQRRGPSTDGLGRRESTTTAASVASGRDLYRSRHPQKTS